MSATFQTVSALALVALAATWLILQAIAKRKNPGCGGDCGAVSPELRKLQSRLKQQRH